MLALLSLFIISGTNFLGFNHKTNLINIGDRFGSPFSISQIKDNSLQIFDYKRESYIFRAIFDKNGNVTQLGAFGMNKSVKYKGIALLDDFKKIIATLGAPNSYEFTEKQIIKQIILPIFGLPGHH
jgi:hypothetical protein